MRYIAVVAMVMCLAGCITKVEVTAGAKPPVKVETGLVK